MMLELIVDKVVKDVLNGENPNDAIVKVAQEFPNLTNEHIKRIIEMTNVRVFNELFKQGQHEFDVADPAVIFKKLNKSDGIEKGASDEDFMIRMDELFGPEMEKSASGGEDFLSKAPRWWHDEKTESEIPGREELIKVSAKLNIRRLLSGKDYKIPTIEKVAHILDEKDRLNLEFKKAAGFEESDELAEEILKLFKILG